MPFVVVTLFLFPFVFRLYSDGSAVCRIRRLPHPPFAASAVCRIRRLPHPPFAASAVCRIRRLLHPPFAPSAVCPASGAVRVSGGFWCVPGGIWREAPARNAVRSGTPVGTRATIRASGRRARGRASGLVLARSGFLVASGAFWAVSLGTGVIEAVQAFARWMSRLIRSSGRLAGTGVIEAVRVSRAARRGAQRMIRAKRSG